MADTPVPPALLSMRDVCRITTLSRTMINKYRSSGAFPEPVPLGPKRFAFLASDIAGWIEGRAKFRKGAATKAAA